MRKWFALTLVGITATAMMQAPVGAQPTGGAQRGLMAADANGDGGITRDEWIAHATARFQQMDQDGDGRVAVADFQRPMGGPGGGAGNRPPPPPPGDRAAANGGPPPPPPGGPRGMGHMAPPQDSNGDGFIDSREYLTAAEARFDALDRNHDGVLRRGELPQPPRPRPQPDVGSAPLPGPDN